MALPEISDSVKKYQFCFGIERSDPLFVHKTKVQDRWLCGASYVPSNQVGMALPFDSRVIGVSYKFWEQPECDGEFQFYYDHLLITTAQFIGTRRGMVTCESMILEYPGQISCFFKGTAYNPEVFLLLEGYQNKTVIN